MILYKGVFNTLVSIGGTQESTIGGSVEYDALVRRHARRRAVNEFA